MKLQGCDIAGQETLRVQEKWDFASDFWASLFFIARREMYALLVLLLSSSAMVCGLVVPATTRAPCGNICSREARSTRRPSTRFGVRLLAAQDGGEEDGEERPLEINDDWRKVRLPGSCFADGVKKGFKGRRGVCFLRFIDSR